MSKRIICLALSLLFLFSFSGCANTNEESHPTDNNVENKDNNPFSENREDMYTSIGISSGVTLPDTDQGVLYYDGKPIDIEYEFSSSDKCSMGLMVFVNGILEPLTIAETSEDLYLYKVNLEKDIPQKIKFSLSPHSGKKGDKLTVIFANVFNPEVMDFTDGKVVFGNNHSISQSLPWIIQMNADGLASEEIIKDGGTIEDIPQELKDSYIRTDKDGKTRNMLDNSLNVDVVQNGTTQHQVLSSEDASSIGLNIYGYVSGKYRVTVLGDFTRLKIDDSDYIEISVEKGMLTKVQLGLSKSDLVGVKNFFVVIAPLEPENFLYKSHSLYIKEK